MKLEPVNHDGSLGRNTVLKVAWFKLYNVVRETGQHTQVWSCLRENLSVPITNSTADIIIEGVA
jgi:hypothetical protein